MLYRNEKLMLRMPKARLLFRNVYWCRFEFVLSTLFTMILHLHSPLFIFIHCYPYRF